MVVIVAAIYTPFYLINLFNDVMRIVNHTTSVSLPQPFVIHFCSVSLNHATCIILKTWKKIIMIIIIYYYYYYYNNNNNNYNEFIKRKISKDKKKVFENLLK